MTIRSFLLTLLALTAFFLILSACSGDREPSLAPDECAATTYKFDTCYVTLLDGRTIPCIVALRSGAISCDWGVE